MRSNAHLRPKEPFSHRLTGNMMSLYFRRPLRRLQDREAWMLVPAFHTKDGCWNRDARSIVGEGNSTLKNLALIISEVVRIERSQRTPCQYAHCTIIVKQGLYDLCTV